MPNSMIIRDEKGRQTNDGHSDEVHRAAFRTDSRSSAFDGLWEPPDRAHPDFLPVAENGGPASSAAYSIQPGRRS